MTRTRGAVCVALLLVVAGCSGAPGATTTTGESTTDAGVATAANATAATDDAPAEATTQPYRNDAATLLTVNGDLPANASRVYARVLSLTGWDPALVTVDAEPTLDDGPSLDANDSTFAGLVGLAPSGNDSGVAIAGYATGSSVYVRTQGLSDDAIEATLAHELTHTLQNSERVLYDDWESFDGNRIRTYYALLEGGAEVVEHVYLAEHLNATPATPREARAAYRNMTAPEQYALFSYTVGYAYVATHVDSPRDLEDVYEKPPLTTEELIHDLEPGSEPPTALAVDVEPGAGRYADARGAKGEFFVRVALHAELDWNRSARAGTGWGNDELVAVEAENETAAYVWATRWDTTGDAAEFDAAMRDWLDARGNRTSDGVWRDGEDAFRLVRASEDVVVLVAGAPGYVGNATVTAVGSNVTVAPATNATTTNASRTSATVST